MLKGLEGFIKKQPPETILFEVLDHSIDFFQQPVVKLLGENNYRFVDIKRKLMKVSFNELAEKKSIKTYGKNILAVHESCLPQVRKRLLGV